MHSKPNDNEKKTIAMGRDRDAALTMILPRAMGALRTHGLPYFDHDRTVYLQVESNHFRIWARPKPHFVYLHVGYHHIFSLFHVRFFSDGSGDLLDDRVSVVGWDRGKHFRQWEAECSTHLRTMTTGFCRSRSKSTSRMS